MTRKLPILLGMVGLMMASAADVRACGDKFLAGLRGGPMMRYSGAAHPTRILIYWRPDPESAAGAADASALKESLERAGHTVVVVETPEELSQAAESGDYKVFMMEIQDAREQQRRLAGLSPNAVILPVLDSPTGNDFTAARAEFGHAIKTPTSLQQLLSQIEKSRPRS